MGLQVATVLGVIVSLGSCQSSYLLVEKKSHSKVCRGDLMERQCYLNWDVPNIAFNSLDMWVAVQVVDTSLGTTCWRSFKPNNLAMIENDFRLILICLVILGRIEVVNYSVNASYSTLPWRVKKLGSHLVPLACRTKYLLPLCCCMNSEIPIRFQIHILTKPQP